MGDCTRSWRSLQVSCLRRQFVQGSGLPFSEALSAELVGQVLDEVGVFFRERIFTPVTTLWMLLSQVISPDGSCRNAVMRLVAFRASRGEKPRAGRTGSYCRARKRLPEKVLSRLTQETAARMKGEVPERWRWHGRDVKVVDGTTLSMPDTRANQRAYPQPKSQKPGLGFPLVRLVCLFSLATGAVLDAALGPCRGKGKGALSLFRKLRTRLQPGDVLLGDRSYCAYFDIAHGMGAGVDFVGRVHQARIVDFRQGKRLSKCARLVEWTRPKQRPRWLSKRAYRRMPETLTLRLIRVDVEQLGFRTRRITVATTLLDSELYPAAEVAALYRARWHAELDLRSLQVTLAMDGAAGQVAADRTEGDLGSPVGVQPDPLGDGSGGRQVHDLASVAELQSYVADDSRLRHVRVAVQSVPRSCSLHVHAGGDRHPPCQRSPRPLRASCPQTAPQTVPVPHQASP